MAVFLLSAFYGLQIRRAYRPKQESTKHGSATTLTRPGCSSSTAPAPLSGRATGRRLSAGPPEGPRSARPSADRRPDRPGVLRAAKEKTSARAEHACASPTSDRRPRRRTSATSDGFQLPQKSFFRKYFVIKNPFPIKNDSGHPGTKSASCNSAPHRMRQRVKVRRLTDEAGASEPTKIGCLVNECPWRGGQ